MTRKNAIIAVTKSAYATFHTPPPLAAMVNLLWEWTANRLLCRRRAFLGQRFGFAQARPAFRADDAAGAHDDLAGALAGAQRNDRRHHAAQERDLRLAQQLHA